MLLIIAVVAGFLIGVVRSKLGNRPYAIPQLNHSWLVLIAFLPQWLVFYLPVTRRSIPVVWVKMALISSLCLLLIFVGVNSFQQRIRNRICFGLLGLGLILNTTVILANQGLMPISPKNASRLASDAPPGSWEIGSRFGSGKDIVLTLEQTRLWWLSDTFYLPLPGRGVAFSLGDILIATGVFLVLCMWDSPQAVFIPMGLQNTSTTNRGKHNV